MRDKTRIQGTAFGEEYDRDDSYVSSEGPGNWLYYVVSYSPGTKLSTPAFSIITFAACNSADEVVMMPGSNVQGPMSGVHWPVPG